MLLHARPDLGGVVHQNFPSDHNDQVSGRQAILLFAKAFPKQTFQRVAFYRFLNLLSCNCESEARAQTLVFAHQNGNTRITLAEIIFKYLLKVARAR